MDKKQRVLYVITKSNFGGAQRYVYDLATNLSNEFDVIVALGGEGVLKDKLDGVGIRTISIPQLQRNVRVFYDLTVFFKLFKIFLREKPDIVHLNSSKIGGLGALAGRFARIKRIVFTAHGWAFNEERNIISKMLIMFLSWTTVLLSHKTIVVSENDRGYAPHLLVRNKIAMIHNGISDILYKDREAARHLLKRKVGAVIPQKALWIGTISELHRNKGLPYAIQAVSELAKEGQNIIFLIIGEGEERSALEEIIKKYNMENRIFLLGHIDNAAILLSALDIFTLTSVKEGLPYVVLEAGFSGLSTVASSVGGVPEIIDDMRSGILVRPRSAKELEKAFSYLILKKEKRVVFGNTLREKIKREFTVKRMVEETRVMYQLHS